MAANPTPSFLELAINDRHSELAERLHALRQEMTRALCYAARHGHDSCLEMLLNFKVDVNNSTTHGEKENDGQQGDPPLLHAVFFNHPRCVDLLIRGGADVNAVGSHRFNALTAAVDKSNLDCLRLLVQAPSVDINARNCDGETAVLKATRQNRAECLRILLTHPGVDVNLKNNAGTTALITAAASETHVDCLGPLLSCPNVLVNTADRDGRTALFYAVDTLNEVATYSLLKFPGIYINLADSKGYSILDAACDAGDPEVVYTMLREGALVTATPFTNRTPLMLMASQGNDEMVECLIQCGVSVTECDVQHKNALYFAATNRHFLTLIILINALREVDKDNAGMMLLFHRAARMRQIFSSLPILLRGRVFQWNWYPSLFKPSIRRIFRRIVISGTPPGEFMFRGLLCTPLSHALLIQDLALARYILANLYLAPRDLTHFQRDQKLCIKMERSGSGRTRDLFCRLRQNVWRLDTLALLAISALLGNTENRHRLVKRLRLSKLLPRLYVRQLAFRTDFRSRPVSSWNRIPLTGFLADDTSKERKEEGVAIATQEMSGTVSGPGQDWLLSTGNFRGGKYRKTKPKNEERNNNFMEYEEGRERDGGGMMERTNYEEEFEMNNESATSDDDEDGGWETLDEEEEEEEEEEELSFEEEEISDEDMKEIASDEDEETRLERELDLHHVLDGIDYLINSNDTNAYQPLPFAVKPQEFLKELRR